MTSLAGPVWVDTHCHLDDPAFDDSREQLLADAAGAGVERVINVGYRPERWETTLALAASSPMVAYSLGIHPGHADEFSPETCDALSRLCHENHPSAIGEIGMDFYWDGPSAALQQDALRAQLRLARDLGIPAIIHQRAAEAEILAVFESEQTLPALVLH
ncbi:MAG: TatD family hydrolase, partial [Thermomicrobiales bacterium]